MDEKDISFDYECLSVIFIYECLCRRYGLYKWRWPYDIQEQCRLLWRWRWKYLWRSWDWSREYELFETGSIDSSGQIFRYDEKNRNWRLRMAEVNWLECHERSGSWVCNYPCRLPWLCQCKTCGRQSGKEKSGRSKSCWYQSRSLLLFKGSEWIRSQTGGRFYKECSR